MIKGGGRYNGLPPPYLAETEEECSVSLRQLMVNEGLIPSPEDDEKRRIIILKLQSLFRSLLRCVKLWAKRRGVYGNLNGFLGGVHMAILAAFVCGYEPNATLSSLVASFFNTFAYWRWPTPVVLLRDAFAAAVSLPGLMPIQLPCGRRQYCNLNVTRSTFYKIMLEFLRGHHLTKGYLMKPSFNWNSLFEPYPYATTYAWFVKIHLSASNQEDLSDWVGWVKSRFRSLLIKIEEEVFGLCDPNPTEYVESFVEQPNIVCYWGLHLRDINVSDIESVETDFLKNVNNSESFQGLSGGIQLSVVQASQLPTKNFECDRSNISKKVTRTCWRGRKDKQRKNTPVYSRHVRGYVVGYEKMNNIDAESPHVLNGRSCQ